MGRVAWYRRLAGEGRVGTHSGAAAANVSGITASADDSLAPLGSLAFGGGAAVGTTPACRGAGAT